MPVSISVGDAPAELRAAVLAMKQVDRSIRGEVSADLRAVMGPVWRQEVTQRLTGSSRFEGQLLTAGLRIAAGNPPALVAASGRRKVGRGLTPNANAAGYEFGASDAVREVTSKKGKKFKRHVMRHLPPRNRHGRVVYPAAANVLPRMASFWVQSIVRRVMDAAEGKKG